MSKVDSTKHSPLGFREFLIGDLFEIKLSDGDNRPLDLEPGIVPLISAGDSNNGIVGYFNSSTTIFKENSLTVDMFGYVYYQPKPFQTVSHGRVNILQIKNGEELSENIMLYLASAISKVTLQSEFGFSKMASSHRVKSLTIQLPVLANNQPDYEYMDYFVEELKHKYVEELDAWWSQAGFASLSDTLLTGNDRNVLNKYQQAQFKDFLIGELFDVKGTNQVFQNDELDVHDNQTDIYNVPYVVRKDGDNGIKGYVDGSLVHSDDLNQGNVITFAQDTFVSYYQPYPFITGNKIKILIFKDGDLSFNLSQWFVSGINKLIKGLSWGAGSTVASIKELTIQLPVDINDQPDYDLISQYMQVMKKLTIQTHRAWLDKQLVAYQS